MPSKVLSYDERKAAEAAFQRMPCDPRWSSSAKAVYEGITKALAMSEDAPMGLPEEEIFSATN
jgi:hypothetical protein